MTNPRQTGSIQSLVKCPPFSGRKRFLVAWRRLPARHRAYEQWLVKDKGRLLLALAEALAGNARLSLEGDLRGFPLTRIAGASGEETAALRRNTLWPRQDFIVFPLDSTTLKLVLAAVGGNVPRRILHVQIERDGRLEFGAYDRFHPECIVFGPGVARDLIAALVTLGVLVAVPRTDRSDSRS